MDQAFPVLLEYVPDRLPRSLRGLLLGAPLLLETTIDISFNSTAFHLAVTRRPSSNGRLVREKRWDELPPLEFR